MGHEKTLTGLMAALAGANLIYGPGMLESGITFDFAQLVMDNEFARMIKHTVNGFSVNKDTLAVDIIDQTGPAKDFLMHAHTFKHMRSQSVPELIDRKGKEEWRKPETFWIITNLNRFLKISQPKLGQLSRTRKKS